MPGSDFDAVVIGAGFSGLAAGHGLADAGLNFVVLEASGRVGGRVDRGEPLPGVHVDLGGTWAGPTQDRVLAWAEQFGVATVQQHVEGRNQVELQGKITSYAGTIPSIGLLPLLDIGRMQLSVGRASRRVDPVAPWSARNADQLDAINLDEWLRRNRHGRKARTLLGVACKTIWGAESDELSMLYVLSYIASAGGLDPLLDAAGGAQDRWFEGGALTIAERAADALGDRVRFNTEVRALSCDDAGVTVVAAGSDGEVSIRARKVIVALPPASRSALGITPAPPPESLAPGWSMGTLTKVFAIYDEPFWRHDGLSGETLSDQGLASMTFDLSGSPDGPGVLVGFVGGRDAVTYAAMEDSERRSAVLAGYSRLFGERALRPEAWTDRQWSAQRWIGGGPVAFAAPGAVGLTGAGLGGSVGHIHWAGTETSPRWGGYIDGAIRAGERAAEDVSQLIA